VRVEVAVTARSTGVNHVGLCVRDLGASLAFYRDVVGFLQMPTQEDGP
jgi:catechol 2,3-dioxygenase-like lactoylglutathione lyase family enzyme